MTLPDDAPYHAHIYFLPEQREAALELRSSFEVQPYVLFVGRMTEGKAGPHPIPQFEVHFRKASLEDAQGVIRALGLRALVHPLTDDDLADHTILGEWIGGAAGTRPYDARSAGNEQGRAEVRED